MGVKSRPEAAVVTPLNAREVRLGGAVLGYYAGGRGKAEAAAGTGARGARTAKRKFSLADQRLREVELVLADLFGGPVNTDDAEHILAPLAATVAWKLTAEGALTGAIIRTPELTRRVYEHCQRWLPGLRLEEIAEAALAMSENRQNLTADEVGALLGVSWDQRARLGLKTIGVAGMTARRRKLAAKKRKRDRDRERAAAGRKAAGAVPRAEYEEKSDAALARRIGKNRRTIARWRAAGILAEKIAEHECPTFVADIGGTTPTGDGHGTCSGKGAKGGGPSRSRAANLLPRLVMGDAPSAPVHSYGALAPDECWNGRRR